MTQTNFYKKFILYFILFGLIISFSSGIINYIYHNSLQKEILDNKAQEIYDIKITNTLQGRLSNIENTLFLLANNDTLKTYINTPNKNIKEKLQLIFLATANSDKNIMQLRYLSKDGLEKVRIDKDKKYDEAYIIADQKLQNKKNRYYFKQTAQLRANKTWYSKIDLNMENGKIEIPYKPTLRIATPVFIENSFQGIVIINLNASELLKDMAISTVFEHYIIDQDNNYILHPNERYMFNKYKKVTRDIEKDFPQGLTNNNIYTFDLDSYFQNNHLLFILKPKKEYQTQQFINEFKVGVFTLLVNLLLSLIISFILAKKPTDLQKQLLRANQQLNIYNKKLKEDQLFIESILNNSAHAIIATDLDGTITLFNNQAQKLLGYSAKDLIGKQKPDIFHKESEVIQRAKEYSKQLNIPIDPVYKVFTIKTDMGLDNEDEWTYISKHGIEFYVSLHMTALKDTNSNTIGYMGIAEDITHKKYLSKQLDEQRVELETIVNTTKDGIAILDLDTNFLYFNHSYLQMTELTKEELLQTSCAELSAPEDKEKSKKIIQEVIEKGFVDYFEKTCIIKDNKRINISMSLALMPDKQRILIATKDITQSKIKERQLQNYIKLVGQNVITSSTDLKGNITYVSKAFCQISGFSKEELLGKNHRMIKHPDMPQELYENLWNTIIQDKVWVGEIKNKKKDGNFYWVTATISPIFCVTGEKIGYTAIRHDITDKKLIEEISITDGLTNIYNRRHFNDIFPKIINSAKRDNNLVSFLIMDIDHFKQYNDTYGHQMGDDVLIQVANTLKSSLNRADDYCFRLGGEEFGIIFKTDSKEQASSFANTIRQNIEQLHIEHKGNSASSYVTASMGLICKPANDIISSEEVYKQGDELLYKAKESGRNQVKTL